jgi:hypothetical protein
VRGYMICCPAGTVTLVGPLNKSLFESFIVICIANQNDETFTSDVCFSFYWLLPLGLSHKLS